MEFRDAVKYLRKELGLTQMELANALHVNFATIGRWEKGKNLPNRSITAALMDFARSKSASKQCINFLEDAIVSAAKEKLDLFGDAFYSVEHSSLRQLIDDCNVPIYVCDFETDDILFLNSAASKMVGENESCAGRKCYECIMHFDSPCPFCDKSKLSEDRFYTQKVHRPTDGLTCYVKSRIIQWNGKKALVRYITSDNTDNILRAVIENVNGGISVGVFSDNGSGSLAFANEKYYSLFGYTKEQFNAEVKATHKLIFPADINYVSETINAIKKTRSAATFRYRVIKRDGSVISVRCSTSVASIDGIGKNVIMSVLTDITDSVEAEQKALVFGQRLSAIMDNINSGIVASMLLS